MQKGTFPQASFGREDNTDGDNDFSRNSLSSLSLPEVPSGPVENHLGVSNFSEKDPETRRLKDSGSSHRPSGENITMRDFKNGSDSRDATQICPDEYRRESTSGEKNRCDSSELSNSENEEVDFRSSTSTDKGLDIPPDGGFGWVCCICVTLIMFSTWGSNSAFGVFLGYYLNNGVFEGATKTDYALIAGMTVFLGQGLPPFVLLFSRIFGFKVPMLLGTVFLFLGYMLASYAVKLWQLYLTQGLLCGMGIAFIFAPATVVLPGWFLRKRSFAVGLSLVGTGAGGVTYSLAVNQIIQRTGDQRWALRTLAIACSVTCLVAIAVIRQRVPATPIGIKSAAALKREFSGMFALRIVKMLPVNLLTAWFTFALFGYTLMIFTLAPYAIARGLTAHQASALTAILNGTQSVGRPLMGLLGDKLGRTNTAVCLTCVNMILLLAFWLPSHTYIQLIFFSVCLGLSIGVANVMSTVLVADNVDAVDFFPSWSYVNGGGAPFFLVSELVAQLLIDETNQENPYLHTQIFAGLCFVCALMMMLLFRELKIRRYLKEQTGVAVTERGETESGNGNRAEDNAEDNAKDDTKDETKDEANCQTIELQQQGRRRLLDRGLTNYFARMFYPVYV